MQFILRLTYCLVLLISVLAGHSFGQLHHELRIEDEDVKIRHFGATADGAWLVGATDDDLYVWDTKKGKLAKQIKYSADRMAVNATAGHVLLRNDNRRDATGLDQLDIASQVLTSTKISLDLRPLQFSADGKRLLCENSEEDGYQVYEYPAMKPLLTTRLKQENTQDIVKLSPNGKLLAFVEDNIVEVWSVESGERVARSGKHIRFIDAIAFSPDETKIAVGGEILGREGFAVFHANTLLPIKRNIFECHSAIDVAWSRDSTAVAVLFDEGRACIIDPISYDLKASFLGDRMERIYSVPGGQFLATTHYNGGPSVWDWQATKRFKKPRLKHTTHAPTDGKDRSIYTRSLHVLWSRDGTRIALACGTPVAYEEKVRRGGIGNITTATRDNIVDGTGNKKSRTTVTRYKKEYSVRLLNPKTGEPTNELRPSLLPVLREYHVDKICYTPDGSQLACLLKEASTFALWNPTNNRVQVISDKTTRTWPHPRDFDFSTSGKSVAFVSRGDLYTYDVGKNKFTSTIEGKFADSIKFISNDEFLSGFSIYSRAPIELRIKGGSGSELLESNGLHAFSLRYDRPIVYRWNVETLDYPSPFRMASPALCISLSKDGKLFAAGCVDGLIRVWDVVNGRLLTNLKGHIGSVESIDFAPQGLILASAGRDGKTMIWDLRDLKDESVAQQKPSLPTQQTFRTASGASVSVSFDRPATDAEVMSALQEALKEVSEKN